MISKSNNSKIGWLPWLICGLAAVFYAYEYLLRVSPSVMMPQLMQAFGVSAASLGLLSSAYYAAYTPVQLPAGLMMDRFGPRRILTLAVLCCAVGAALFAITDSLMLAGIGRFLMGFGSAFAFVGVLKLATIWLPPDRFGFVAGLATTLGMLGAISGERILGKTVFLVGWQQTIIYSGIVGLILTPLMWWIIRDHNDQHPDAPHTQRIALKQCFFEAFRIIQNRQIWLNGLIAGLMFMPITVFAELWGVEYLKVTQGYNQDQATWGTSMIFLGWAIGGPIVGNWSDTIRRRRLPMTLGSLFAALAISFVMYVPGLSAFQVNAGLFMLGFFGSAQVLAFAVGRENCSITVAATAVAATNFLINLAGGTFQPLVGKIMDMCWDGQEAVGMHVYSPETYTIAISVVPIALLLAVVLSFFLKETHCHQPH